LSVRLSAATSQTQAANCWFHPGYACIPAGLPSVITTPESWQVLTPFATFVKKKKNLLLPATAIFRRNHFSDGRYGPGIPQNLSLEHLFHVTNEPLLDSIDSNLISFFTAIDGDDFSKSPLVHH